MSTNLDEESDTTEEGEGGEKHMKDRPLTARELVHKYQANEDQDAEGEVDDVTGEVAGSCGIHLSFFPFAALHPNHFSQDGVGGRDGDTARGLR